MMAGEDAWHCGINWCKAPPVLASEHGIHSFDSCRKAPFIFVRLTGIPGESS
jgi:hypothetical protein